MKKNINLIGRSIRIIVGLFLTSMVFWGPSNAWFWLGLIPVAAGLVGYCPPCALMGISEPGCCSATKSDSEKNCCHPST